MNRQEQIRILEDARALIADKKNWTKGIYRVEINDWVETSKGRIFKRKELVQIPYDQYCMIGAVRAASGFYGFSLNTVLAAEDAARLLSRTLRRTYGFSSYAGGHPQSFNDAKRTSHKDVLAIFDKTIEELKQAEFEAKRDQLYESVGELTGDRPVAPPKEEDVAETVQDRVLIEV